MRIGYCKGGREVKVGRTSIVQKLDAFCGTFSIGYRPHARWAYIRICGPLGVFNISCTALTACSTSANWAIATLEGMTGARRSVAE